MAKNQHARPGPPQHAREERHHRGPLQIIGLSLSAVLLVLTMALATIAIIVPKVTGSQTYTVLTRSMEPDYPPGTYLVVRPTPAENLQIGDVITYQIESGKPEVVTHRIVAASINSDGERRFVTRGDNNGADDPVAVRPVQIRGSLWYAIPYLGWATGLRSESASSIWIPIAAGLLIAYAVFQVGSWAVDKRRKKKMGEDAGQVSD